jgi:biotin carboxyl carrier protein
MGDHTRLAVIGPPHAISLTFAPGGGSPATAIVVEPPDRVTVDGEACTVVQTGPGTFRVLSDGRQRLAHAILDGDHVWISCDGITHRVRLQEPSEGARPRTAPGAGSLSAPMPATVVGVHVAAGEAVQTGDLLISLEAMKMELPIRAPSPGVVKTVLCRVGELVQPDVPLLELA